MQLLKLRYFQIKRDLSYWAILIAVLMGYLASEVGDSSSRHVLLFIGLIFVALCSHFSKRSDLAFLETYFKSYKIQIALNYSLLVLPISFGLLLTQHWPYAFILHALVPTSVLFKFKSAQRQYRWLTNLVPKKQFEWIAGIRTYFFGLLLFFILAVLLSPVKLFGTFALFVLNAMIVSFYNQSEPLQMLNPNSDNTLAFLKKKVEFGSRITFLINLPLLVINAIAYPEVLWLNLGMLMALLALLVCGVYIKYAYYEPNRTFNYKIDLVLLYLSALLPYLLPLSFFIYLSSKRKAKNAIDYYTT